MKRWEWVMLIILIVGVAALEVLGTGEGSPQHPQPAGSVEEATRPAEPAGPSEATVDPMAAYRTVRLHVTGMT